MEEGRPAGGKKSLAVEDMGFLDVKEVEVV